MPKRIYNCAAEVTEKEVRCITVSENTRTVEYAAQENYENAAWTTNSNLQLNTCVYQKC